MIFLRFGIFVFLLLFQIPYFAAEKPDPIEIKRVIDYYLSSNSHAILIEKTFCRRLNQHKAGPLCLEPHKKPVFKQNEEVFLVMQFFAPEREKQEIIMAEQIIGHQEKVSVLEFLGAFQYFYPKKIFTKHVGRGSISLNQTIGVSSLQIGFVEYEVKSLSKMSSP